MRTALSFTAALFITAAPGWAQQSRAPASRPELAGEQELAVTHHQATIGGQRIDYTAHTGYLALHGEAGNHRANVFFTAYLRDGVTSKRERPITFAFNGGPGAASIWLHMGGLGPKRVRMADPGAQTRFDPSDPQLPPFDLVSNEHSWLDFTDLVFIDPVGTGYSRAAPGVKPTEFWGYTEDIEYLAEVIRQLTTRFERWGSPKFLAGESYGTPRVSGLSNHLQERHGMHLNGIVLISAVLNFQTISYPVGNDLGFLTIMPTFAATAWYHKRHSPELQQDLERTLIEAREFVAGDYSRALLLGDRLPQAERARVVAKYAQLTGLSPEFVERSNLRVSVSAFTKELRRSDRRTVGRLDGRFIGIDREAAGERGEYDPSYSGAIMGPFTAMFNDYVRRELKYTNGLSYEVRGRVQPWPMSPPGGWGGYRNVAEELRQAMSINPYLRVFVGAGYYDMATPFYGMEYTIATMQLDAAQRGQVDFEYYPAGHMYYVHEPSLAKFKTDIMNFYRATLTRTRPVVSQAELSASPAPAALPVRNLARQ